jgi:long-chain acyl-CoA synthetase
MIIFSQLGESRFRKEDRLSHSKIVAAVQATAARGPERVAIASGSDRVSYAQLMQRMHAVASALHGASHGASREIIGLLCSNRPEFAYGVLGALAAGKTVAVLPTLAPPPLLAMMAADAGVRRVLSTEELAPRLSDAKVECLLIAKLAQSGEGKQAPAQESDGKPPHSQEAAVLLYTSGSTGRPKAVALSDENILANIQGSVDAAGFVPDDVMLAILPLFHSYGLTVTLLLPLVLGARVVMLERFAPRSVLAAIEEHRVTAVVAVPTQYRLLAKDPTPCDASSLRLCIAGAERLAESVSTEFAARFGKQILQGYGATEASPVVALNPPWANRPGAVGKPLPNIRVTVRNAQGPVATGELGEVCVEGPSVMLGYFNRPEATAEKIPGGVLRTGDLGWLDADGYLFLAGRSDDLIKVAGEKIYPAEVERAIEQIEGVEEVAVVGVPDATRGAALVAFVQPKAGVTLTEQSLRAACRGCVDGMKLPRSFVVMEQLPRSPTGKLDKKSLAERATEQR